MATHGLGLGQEAVTLHTKAGVPHTTSLPSGPTETGDGDFFFIFLGELSCFVLRIYIPDWWFSVLENFLIFFKGNKIT